jgi:hypothetical protein
MRLESDQLRELARLIAAGSEPWLDRKALAAHLGCSLRSIDYRVEEGMPYATVMGRPKFKASEVEAWLETNGHLERRIDDGGTVVAGSANGAAPADNRPAPGHEE